MTDLPRLEPDDPRVERLYAEADEAIHLIPCGEVKAVFRWMFAQYVLVPVTQREAEQRVIAYARERFAHRDLGLFELLEALAAIPVDTEAK